MILRLTPGTLYDIGTLDIVRSESSGELRQIKITESFERQWDINDSRAKIIHQAIGEMIVLDNQPFSVVENKGKMKVATYYY
ncbi:unnamed protein product [Acanthoscelides obtectus]|uniref:Uncharacterized protein n=1 Tax=Acanthoscelides obtectus TaxID=200917 RepID=A0A9P0KSP6_ACAOB|nr:unnamed protein product [Acanthoscelides obtectus]CAK1671932.1 hypothetical protein AOBTE_LOCUS28543 [Acanthoscelides obtectus]